MTSIGLPTALDGMARWTLLELCWGLNKYSLDFQLRAVVVYACH